MCFGAIPGKISKVNSFTMNPYIEFHHLMCPLHLTSSIHSIQLVGRLYVSVINLFGLRLDVRRVFLAKRNISTICKVGSQTMFTLLL